jgi:NDP-sugar pyrophosphorylase family protein
MIDCIILAGGKNNKIHSDEPKALVRINEKELISHQIDYLQDKVRKIIVSTGYKAESVEEFLSETYPELAIVCVRETESLGTAGAIRNCIDEVESDRVLIVNCDDVCDLNVSHMEEVSGNVICVHNPQLPFGVINKSVEEGESVMGKFQFLEKPIMKGLWSSCGWYILTKDIIKHFPIKGSLEYNVFPKLDFNIYKHLGKWYTFNTMGDVELFEKENSEQ